jgi:hypothetical protein
MGERKAGRADGIRQFVAIVKRYLDSDMEFGHHSRIFIQENVDALTERAAASLLDFDNADHVDDLFR